MFAQQQETKSSANVFTPLFIFVVYTQRDIFERDSMFAYMHHYTQLCRGAVCIK